MRFDRKLLFVILLIPSAALLLLEIFPPTYCVDDILNNMVRVIVTRFIGCLVFVPLSMYMGYNIFGFTDKSRGKVLLCSIVPFIVVINNLPIIGLLSGEAYVTKPYWYIAVLALESVMIALFEEFAFRGVLFPYILESCRLNCNSIFWATVISSAAFGAVHLFNLLAGGGIGAVILQVGYSFLIGGMCSIVLLYTRCIWLCVALHAIYDFCGYLIPTLGAGIIWDYVTIIVTVVLGVFALIFMLVWLSKITPERVNGLYSKSNNEENASD